MLNMRKTIGLTSLALVLLPFAVAAIQPPNVVHIQANDNCYFGGTEDKGQAQHGSFGTVYISKGHSYDWKVSKNRAALYWGAIRATNSPQPMPKMVQRGTAFGGQTVFVP